MAFQRTLWVELTAALQSVMRHQKGSFSYNDINLAPGLGNLAAMNREVPPLDKSGSPSTVSLFQDPVSVDWAQALEPFSDWIIELFGSQPEVLDTHGWAMGC